MTAVTGAAPTAVPPAARGWAVALRLLVIVAFAQSVFAGVLLSGEDWGRTAHEAGANVLFLGTVAAGVGAFVSLRRYEGGRRIALQLAALAAGLVVQVALGRMAAEGEDVLWLHVPLGVALVGAAAQPFAGLKELR